MKLNDKPEFIPGELAKIDDSCYVIIIGEKGYNNSKNHTVEIFTSLSGRTVEVIPSDKLNKIELLTQREKEIREKLVHKYNEYVENKAKNTKLK